MLDIIRGLSAYLLIAISFAVFSLNTHAKPSVDDYGALPEISAVAMSPSGKLIAIHKDNKKDTNVIGIYSLDKNKNIATTQLGELKIHNMYFISEEQIIIVGSELKKVVNYKRQHRISTAFSIDTHTGDIRQLLIPGKGVYARQAGLGNIIGLSPDGKYAYMPAIIDKSSLHQDLRRSVVKVPLEEFAEAQSIEIGTPESLEYYVNNEGKIIAEVRFDGKKELYQIMARQGKEAIEIYRFKGEKIPLIPVGLTPDYQSLVISQTINDHITYHTMSLADGKLSKRIFDRSDAEVEQVYRDINQVVHGVRYSGFFPSYQFFDTSINEHISEAMNNFPEQAVWLSDANPDWENMLFYVEGWSSQGQYHLSKKGQAIKSLLSSRSKIKPTDIHPMASYQYNARDGLKIPTLLTIPANKVNHMKNLPAVMLPHGGPASYDKVSFHWLAQALANEGYLVIQPQFRGSTGFGLDHLKAGDGEWGKKMQHDLTDGVNHLVKRGMIDPQRVCIVGGSYGGYAALAGGAFTPELYQCVVSINGVSDLPRFIKQEKRDHGRGHWVLDYWKTSIANTDNAKKVKRRMKEVSPARHAEKFKAPVLLLHGDQDKIVNIQQSVHMYKKLKRADKKVTLKKLKGEDHNLSTSQTRIDALNALVAFVNEHISISTLASKE